VYGGGTMKLKCQVFSKKEQEEEGEGRMCIFERGDDKNKHSILHSILHRILEILQENRKFCSILHPTFVNKLQAPWCL